jgi:hypothetical protein
MKIDIFKSNLFTFLEKNNQALKEITSDVDWKFDPAMGLVLGHKISTWFNPNTINLNPLPDEYPIPRQHQHDKKWNLILNIPNYTSLFVINELYKHNKYVHIEDACCGMGNLAFYLMQLGFYNFSFIDNWSQCPEFMLERVLAKNIGNYAINYIDSYCEIINFSSYIYYPRHIRGKDIFFSDGKEDKIYINKRTELFCSYMKLPHIVNPLIEDYNFTFLCSDKDETMHIYCRKDKYEEFKQKLEPFVIQG